MKNIVITLFALAITFAGCAQDKKPASPAAVLKTDLYTINYSSPAKKGRVIFGDLVPYGQVWRTGANAATEITLNKDVTIGDKSVKAGTYTLFTVPGQDDWTVILNSKLKQWGAYKYDKSANVAEVVVPSSSTEPTENFTIVNDNDGNIILKWDTTQVVIPISAN